MPRVRAPAARVWRRVWLSYETDIVGFFLRLTLIDRTPRLPMLGLVCPVELPMNPARVEAMVGGGLLALLLATTWSGCGGPWSGDARPDLGLGDGGGATAQGPSTMAILRSMPALRGKLPREARLVEDGEHFAIEPSLAQRRPGLLGLAPRTAQQPLRLERPEAGGVWLDLVPLGRASVAAEVQDGAVVYRRADVATDVVVVLEPARVEELRLLYGP